jgi:hypothetical protein
MQCLHRRTKAIKIVSEEWSDSTSHKIRVWLSECLDCGELIKVTDYNA